MEAMPRYFFHVYDGGSELDHEGMELPGYHRALKRPSPSQAEF